MAERSSMGLQEQERTRASDRSRDDVLREQWSEGFATRLLRVVRRAIAKEIQDHEAAGRTLPQASPDEARAEAPHGPRN